MPANAAKLVSGVALLLVPVGFVSSALASPAEDVSALVNAWIGHTEQELLEVWGEGLSTTSASGDTLHIYSARGRGASGIRVSGAISSIPIGGTRSGAGQADGNERTMRERGGCDVTFEIRRGVVADVSWSTEGSPDREAARRTCWHEFRRNKAE